MKGEGKILIRDQWDSWLHEGWRPGEYSKRKIGLKTKKKRDGNMSQIATRTKTTSCISENKTFKQ